MTRHLIFLCILLAASSCSIEKQLYSKGFHVEFHKRQRSSSSDSPDAITRQPTTKIAETEQVTTIRDSIIDASILQEEEKLVPQPAKKQVIPDTQVASGKSKKKITANRIRTAISIQTHFSESLMSKSLKREPKKRSEKRSRDFDWEEFGEWLLIIGAFIGCVLLASTFPGVTLLGALVGTLAGILVICLLALLISNACGNFEWFWSGR